MRATRTALIMAAIVTAVLFAIGRALEAAPVVRAIQTITVQRCAGQTCTQSRQSSPGSGTCVGRDKAGRLLVLTCAHGWTANGPTVVLVDGQTPEAAAIVGFDGAKDLCLLAVEHPAPVHVFQIAATVPAIGAAATTQGFPHADKLRTVQTRIKSYGAGNLITAATFRPGESGGAVLVDNELVGVIQRTSYFDGSSANLRSVQDFIMASLGYQPIVGPPVAPGKPADVPVPKLVPVPHPEPLPAPILAPGPEPAPTPPTHDDIRGIVSDELAKLAPQITSAGKAELVKQLGLHAADLKQVVTASAAEGRLDPSLLTPILESAAQGAAQDVSRNVAQQVVPSLLTAVASHLGMGALAGAVGGPIGALAGGAIGLVGFFLNRTLKRGRMPATGPQTQSQPALAPSPANLVHQFPVAVESPPAPQAIIPTRTFQQVEVDRTAEALDWALGELVKKYPGSEGTVSTLQSLVSQYRSGAQAPVA